MISVVISFLTLSVDAFRIRFFNMIIETSQRFSSVSMEENYKADYTTELPEEWGNYYYPTILPDGYKFFNAFETNDTKYMTFTNESGYEIRFIQGNISSELQLDSENGKMIEVKINGNKGIIVEKEGVHIISWHNNEKSFYIQGNVDKSTLLEISESVGKNL